MSWSETTVTSESEASASSAAIPKLSFAEPSTTVPSAKLFIKTLLPSWFVCWVACDSSRFDVISGLTFPAALVPLVYSKDEIMGSVYYLAICFRLLFVWP